MFAKAEDGDVFDVLISSISLKRLAIGRQRTTSDLLWKPKEVLNVVVEGAGEARRFRGQRSLLENEPKVPAHVATGINTRHWYRLKQQPVLLVCAKRRKIAPRQKPVSIEYQRYRLIP